MWDNVISHWERMAACVSSAGMREEGHGPEACAFCLKYNNEVTERAQENCVGCPIFEDTGKPYCQDTPYTDFATTLKYQTAVPRYEALTELDYLKRLREKTL